MDTDPAMHPGDPQLRRTALWLLPTTIILGAAGLWALRGWLAGTPHGDDALQGLLTIFLGLVALLTSVSLALAWSLWTQAGRIHREDRYPASDMRTLRPVPIRRGESARHMATRMRMAAGLLAVLALALLAWMFWSLRVLG